MPIFFRGLARSIQCEGDVPGRGTQPAQAGGSEMKHFGLAEWTDYARRVAAEDQRKAMEAHLAEGCKNCERSLDLIGTFAKTAKTAASYEAPDYMVRCARAIFALQQPEKVHILPRALARLLYDSFREPLPAGIRSQQRLSRQALYEAGDFRLDLRLEQERGGSSVSLVGQIENRRDPQKRVGQIPVLLASGKEVVAKTLSNHFGEFQFTYRPKTGLRLYVPVLGEQTGGVDVALSGLAF